MAKAAAAKKTAVQGNWSVIDTNVLNPKHVGPTRLHVARDPDGTEHPYNLPGFVDKTTKKGCEMPADHALQFLIDPSFKVYDATGKLIQALKPQTAAQGLSLQRHETVATFQELTRDALFNRVKRLPGGQMVPVNTTNAKLIELLMTGGAPNTERVAPEDDSIEIDPGKGEDGDAEEVDLEGGALIGGELPAGLAARKAEVMSQLARKPAPEAGLD